MNVRNPLKGDIGGYIGILCTNIISFREPFFYTFWGMGFFIFM